MNPSLLEGDIVFFKPYQNKKHSLKTGSILIAKHPFQNKTLIIKRLLRQSSGGVELIGDNLPSSTDSRHFGLINYENIIGVAERVLPRASKYWFILQTKTNLRGGFDVAKKLL